MKPDMKSSNKKIKELMESDSGESISNDMFDEVMKNCDIENFTYV